MRNILPLTLLIFLLPVFTFAQQPVITPSIRVVDTLSATEKSTRNIILLRAELDSMISAHADKALVSREPVNEKITSNEANNTLLLAGVGGILFLLVVLLFLVNRHQKKINRIISGTNSQAAMTNSKDKKQKGKQAIQTQEGKISDLHAELLKLTKENEGLNRVITEYNGIRHEYESLKHGIQKTYKVRNYPGNDQTKDENLAMQGVFDTETSVANYAYEKFLKPVLSIADRNKNNPARISDADRRKVLDLLVSLSLLYTEYLYLRVNDLAVGGKMVERIKGFGKGNGLDPALLKKMNTESGNRALVLRMILNKSDLQHLSYPVFDETNLNHQ